jgi:MYXO-CTERM domain-containing protein
MQKIHLTAIIAVCALPAASSNAATLAAGYTTGSNSQLLTANGGSGSILFTDSAAPGGSSDVVAGGGDSFNSVLLPGSGLWGIGDTVSITGLALVLRGQSMGSGNFTFNIREGAGGTGASGAAGLDLIGSATASYTTTSNVSTMYVNFDTPVNFVVDANSTTIGVNFSFDGGNVSYKAGTELTDGLVRYNFDNGNIVGGANPSLQRFSVAGSVTPIPEPSTALLGALGMLALLRRRR